MAEKHLTDGTTALAAQPRVIKIEAAEKPRNAQLRVAAYTRVSSDSDDQLNSFAAQHRYYAELISGKAEWRMVDIYADEGITGTSDALNTEAIMNLIAAINPDIDTIGLLYDLSQDASTQAIADAKAFCDSKGIQYIEKNGTTTAEVQMAAEALIAAGVKAVFTPTDNTIMTAELSIYETFTEAGVQHYTGADSFALNGAFVGYGVDYVQLGEATADMVVELLCDGKTPADLPFQTFDNGIATINTETCEALGLDLDTVKKAFAPYCTEVVEVTTAENFG